MLKIRRRVGGKNHDMDKSIIYFLLACVLGSCHDDTAVVPQPNKNTTENLFDIPAKLYGVNFITLKIKENITYNNEDSYFETKLGIRAENNSTHDFASIEYLLLLFKDSIKSFDSYDTHYKSIWSESSANELNEFEDILTNRITTYTEEFFEGAVVEPSPFVTNPFSNYYIGTYKVRFVEDGNEKATLSQKMVGFVDASGYLKFYLEDNSRNLLFSGDFTQMNNVEAMLSNYYEAPLFLSSINAASINNQGFDVQMETDINNEDSVYQIDFNFIKRN